MAKKEKLTLQQQLAKKQFHQPNGFLYGFLAKVLINPILAPKFHPHVVRKDDINDCKGPCFLIYNHQSRSDYLWLVKGTYPRKLNFVTGHNEFFRKKFDGIFKILQNIPKKNFTNDFTSMRGMNQIIKSGGCVCFAPEGMSSIYGHNQPVVTGTGRFFKFYNIPVYLGKIKGGYLTNHKVCLDDRLGRVECEISLCLTPEMMKTMTNEEVENYINKVLWQDDYEWQKEQHIKWKTGGNICSHLHDICYKCPKCGEELQMISEKNYIRCNKCGNGAHMNDYYEWEPFDDSCVLKESPSKWVDWERCETIKEIRENPNYSFSEEVEIGELPKYKLIKGKDATSVKCGKGVITVDHQGIHFKGEKHGESFSHDWSYELVPTLCMSTTAEFFALYINGEYYDFFPKRPSTGKILLLVEEMHRLHVNTWKNFPWMDYMYEGYDK